MRSLRQVTAISSSKAVSSMHFSRILTWCQLGSDLGGARPADRLESQLRSPANGGDKAVRQGEFRFRQSEIFTTLDHVPDTGAHALDVFGEIERFREKRVAWN